MIAYGIDGKSLARWIAGSVCTAIFAVPRAALRRLDLWLEAD